MKVENTVSGGGPVGTNKHKNAFLERIPLKKLVLLPTQALAFSGPEAETLYYALGPGARHLKRAERAARVDEHAGQGGADGAEDYAVVVALQRGQLDQLRVVGDLAAYDHVEASRPRGGHGYRSRLPRGGPWCAGRGLGLARGRLAWLVLGRLVVVVACP